MNKVLLSILVIIMAASLAPVIAGPTSAQSFQVDWNQGYNDKNPHDHVVDTPMVQWATGGINKNNSILTEDNILPPYPPNIPGHVNYRAIFGGLPGDTYVLTIDYDFTKGGTVAVDFLTTNYGINDTNLQTELPSWAEPTIVASLVSDGPSAMQFPDDLFPLPLRLGSGDVQDRQAAHDAAFAGETYVRQMEIYGATITGISQGGHTGDVTSDSSVTVEITFTKGTNAGSPVIATWGGHLAIGDAYSMGYGTGNGAGSISGAPFHMTLNSLTTVGGDNILGGHRDLSVQPSAIVQTGTLIVQKVTIGGDSTFNYTIADSDDLLDGFPITTSGRTGSQTYNVLPGMYEVTELEPPTGWDFTNIVIDDPSGGSSSSDQIATIDLDPDETVTVTFTNSITEPPAGTIIVEKQTIPDGSDQSFEFDPSWSAAHCQPEPTQWLRLIYLPAGI